MDTIALALHLPRTQRRSARRWTHYLTRAVCNVKLRSNDLHNLLLRKEWKMLLLQLELKHSLSTYWLVLRSWAKSEMRQCVKTGAEQQPRASRHKVARKLRSTQLP